MKLSLVLALALLGAVSARHLPEGTLEQEVAGELGSAVLEEELRELEPAGSGEGKGLAARCKGLRFTLLKPHTFKEAERECAGLGGRLASIHSQKANESLRRMVQSRTDGAQVWIGGVVSSSGGRSYPHWKDGTRWNYVYWSKGSPSGSGQTCIALCTAGGHWKNVDCGTLLPSICEC